MLIQIAHARRTVIVLKSAFLLALLLASLLVSQGAWAQASANFDLGCRGMLTAGGGIETAPSGVTATISSFGQWTQGNPQSANYRLHTGFVQHRAPSASMAEALTPERRLDATIIYMPIIAQVSRIVRGCQY